MRDISLYFFAFLIFLIWVSVDHAAGLPEALHSYFHSFLINTESCDEDDGEVSEGVVEKELSNKPRTPNGTQLDMSQSILLPF